MSAGKVFTTAVLMLIAGTPEEALCAPATPAMRGMGSHAQVRAGTSGQQLSKSNATACL